MTLWIVVNKKCPNWNHVVKLKFENNFLRTRILCIQNRLQTIKSWKLKTKSDYRHYTVLLRCTYTNNILNTTKNYAVNSVDDKVTCESVKKIRADYGNGKKCNFVVTRWRHIGHPTIPDSSEDRLKSWFFLCLILKNKNKFRDSNCFFRLFGKNVVDFWPRHGVSEHVYIYYIVYIRFHLWRGAKILVRRVAVADEKRPGDKSCGIYMTQRFEDFFDLRPPKRPIFVTHLPSDV